MPDWGEMPTDSDDLISSGYWDVYKAMGVNPIYRPSSRGANLIKEDKEKQKESDTKRKFTQRDIILAALNGYKL